MSLEDHVEREHWVFSDEIAGADDLYYITIKV